MQCTSQCTQGVSAQQRIDTQAINHRRLRILLAGGFQLLSWLIHDSSLQFTVWWCCGSGDAFDLVIVPSRQRTRSGSCRSVVG